MTSRRNICDFLVCDNDRVANDGGSRTWIVRLDQVDPGARLAVKDCIDVQGLPTTVGCPGVAAQARPAARDAAVVAAARRSGAGQPSDRAGRAGRRIPAGPARDD